MRTRRKFGKLKRGQRFGRLRIVRRLENNFYECICDCGTKKSARADHLRCGTTRSCGCLRRECGRIAGLNRRGKTTKPNSGQFKSGHGGRSSLKHGHAAPYGGSLTYRSWTGMLARVFNPKHPHHKYYKDVKVADRWNPKKGGSFENFLADMGERPTSRHSLGRILDGPLYSKETCEWELSYEQGAQRKGRAAQARLRLYRHLQKVLQKIREAA
jgi:hypothetical protein